MAAAGPSSDDVRTFKDITQCLDDALAIRFLQGAGQNIETAISEFYDNPNRYDGNTGYDNSSRYGEESTDLNSFNIYPHDEPSYGGYNRSTAPTRPNSRNSDSSMKVLMDPQESGIIGGSNPNFGPATKEHYESSQWALTVPDANAVEIYPDLETWDLVREDNEPVIMKPLTSRELLPALIAIIGHIPLAQKTLIEAPPALDNYGTGSLWWTGVPFASKIVDTEVPGADPHGAELLAETQRLVAFMMGSDRLYGSVEPLADLQAMKDIESNSDVINITTMTERFLASWSVAMRHYENEQGIPQGASELFENVVVRSEAEQAFPFQELGVSLSPSSDPISLYEAVDQVIWDIDEDGSSAKNRFLSKCAPILILRIHNPNASDHELNVDIPEVWYLDRYMAENQKATKRMRQDMAECRRNIRTGEDMLKSLQDHKLKDASGDTMNIEGRKLLEAGIESLTQTKAYVSQDEDEEDEDEDEDEDDMDNDEDLERAKNLAVRLQRVLDQLNGAFVVLGHQKQELARQLEEMSSLFKQPTFDPNGQPDLKYKYQLRGVCTQPNNVYIKAASPSHLDGESWWRYEYTLQPSIDKTTLDLDDVLHRARYDSRNVLLVYASEEACAMRPISIPPALQTFVRTDNEQFQAERDNAQHDPNPSWNVPTPWPEPEGITRISDEDEDPPGYEDFEMQETYPSSQSKQNVLYSDQVQGEPFDEEVRQENQPPENQPPAKDGPVNSKT
ncbi:hypothetical protein BT63DRAFT_455226 [Microthyrium microscopicum]|uniref:Ubiquitin interaction motif protein n=1 Tax=Microthyrium microscopicum TaxID=703497 RepID=A0A6A6UAF9_9PEZI|nr:hypothetical protein BT63DRAFT_455226 [Microthyrium microscopicum]